MSLTRLDGYCYAVDGVSNRDSMWLGRRDELVGVHRLLAWVVLVRRRCVSVGWLEMYAVECICSAAVFGQHVSAETRWQAGFSSG